MLNYGFYNFKCCENCSNNPINNPWSSGACNCTLPYLETLTAAPRINMITSTSPIYTNIVTKEQINKMDSRYTYRKKPVEIEAIQWTGDNYVDVCLFMGREALMNTVCTQILISTLEGTLKASIGDYIIKGVNGEFYPCKPDIFEESYEKVEY